MAVSIRLKPEEERLIKAHIKINGITFSEFARKAMLEKLEDEYDLKVFNKAKEEYKKNPVTYTIDEIEEELGLNE